MELTPSPSQLTIHMGPGGPGPRLEVSSATRRLVSILLFVQVTGLNPCLVQDCVHTIWEFGLQRTPGPFLRAQPRSLGVRDLAHLAKEQPTAGCGAQGSVGHVLCLMQPSLWFSERFSFDQTTTFGGQGCHFTGLPLLERFLEPSGKVFCEGF